MKTIDFNSWEKMSAEEKQHFFSRPVLDYSKLKENVSNILLDVKNEGDAAVLRYAAAFDHFQGDNIVVDSQMIESASARIEEDLKAAIEQAAHNIETFHKMQVENPVMIETMPGVKCWRKSIGIEKVGIYIPGGSAPLFSTVLMLGIPARIAGCRQIVLCTPSDPEGNVPDTILFAAHLVGITRIFKIGGVQAIGAMAYGTQTVPAVSKIFGPGNQYVTCAKRLVQDDGVAIDMPAGPSEVCIIADSKANSSFVASDILSQAEHGADSQAVLISWDTELLQAVQGALQLQLSRLPRREIAEKALSHSIMVSVENEQQAIEIANLYAPEHLIIACENHEKLAEHVVNAGSVFLGSYSPESAGDYASGTNHTLPTGGYARAYSGVSLDSFVKKVTFQKMTQEGLFNIGRTIQLMAAAEGLEAHRNAVSLRLRAIHASMKDTND